MDQILNKPPPFSPDDGPDAFKAFKRDVVNLIGAVGGAPSSERKTQILLNLMAPAGRDRFETLVFEAEADKKDFDKVCKAFEDSLQPVKKNKRYARHIFQTRDKKEAESFENYVQALRKLLPDCEYHADDQQDHIVDKLIIAVEDLPLKCQLLDVDNLTVDEVLQRINLREIRQNQAEKMNGNGKHQEVHQFSRDRSRSRSKMRRSRSRSRSHSRNRYSKERPSFKKKEPYRRTRDREPTPYHSKARYDRNRSRSKSPGTKGKPSCWFCGGYHRFIPRNNCPAYGQQCKKCGVMNHFARECRREDYEDNRSVNSISVCTDPKCEDCDHSAQRILKVDCLNSDENATCWFEKIECEDTAIKFKLDTGAEANVIPLQEYKKIKQPSRICKTPIVLKAYGNFTVNPIGKVKLQTSVNGHSQKEEYLVVDAKVTPIFGLKACVKFELIHRSGGCNGVNIHEVKQYLTKDQFIIKYKNNFQGYGKFPGKIKLIVNKSILPQTRPPRRVAQTIKRKFKKFLKELESVDIIKPVKTPTSWVSNVVIIEKSDGTLRICLDPIELNEAIGRPYFEVPTIQELSTTLSGQKVFSVLDFKSGFWHCELDEESAEVCTFSTPFGCYRMNRLPFGLASSPEHFMAEVAKHFEGLEGVTYYCDDIIVYGKTYEEHDANLEALMKRAQEKNVKFNSKKIQYRQLSVKFVGYIFNEEGRQMDPERISAILKMWSPEKKDQLQSVLGVFNYVKEFIPQYSTVTSPLRELLRADVDFAWLPRHEETLKELKKIITTSPVLGNFQEDKPILIQCDASKDGLGWALIQEGKPITFGSRALSETEQNYAQVEKELLAIVCAVKGNHYFVYGRKVKVQTDHKPLISIFQKRISQIGSSRLQRLRLKLVNYDLDVQYLPGCKMYVADPLSRNYQPMKPEDEVNLEKMVHAICIEDLEMSISEKRLESLKKDTLKDPVLSQVMLYTQTAWPELKKIPTEAVPYYEKMTDLEVSHGLLFMDSRLVIPKVQRQHMLACIHEGHIGITKSRELAQRTVYWPGMSKDIEDYITACQTCQQFAARQRRQKLIPHEVPQRPFQKIGVDILEFGAAAFLILVDYYSKWIEVASLASKKSSAVIEAMKGIFAVHGIPEVVMADNQPFNSVECREFSNEWDFKIVTSSPTYARSNGQAEKAVGIVKQMLRKCHHDKTELQAALLKYRNSPVAGLKLTPAQMLLNRVVRTKMPVPTSQLKPEVPQNVREKIQEKQRSYQKYHDASASRRNVAFKEGDEIYTRSRVEQKWTPGKILAKQSTPRSFGVLQENGRVVRRNEAHLKHRTASNKKTHHEILPPWNPIPVVHPEPPHEEEIIPRFLFQERVQQPVHGVYTRSGRISKPVVRLTL